MKKIVLALTVALLGTLVLNAQPARRQQMTPEQRIEQRVNHLESELSLTKEQRAAITEILTEEAKTMQKDRPAIPANGEKPDEAAMKAHHEQMKAQQEATNAKIAKVLTPEQVKKFGQMERHGKRGHGPGRPHGEKKAQPMDGKQMKGQCCKEGKEMKEDCCKQAKKQ